ncbi:MAG: prolyl oligopeptidase family serine peptidase [Victivallales bacterium]|nr:prolyl oligopeptidase family serine peptidase [Victivallales bacterium]
MNFKSIEGIAKLSSQPPSRRSAMASSLKLGVVTAPSLRSSSSLAAFWRLDGCFAITSILPILFLGLVAFCGDTVRPGLENIEQRPMTIAEEQLVEALKEPFLAGLDVHDALQAWFDGRLAEVKGNRLEALAFWKAGAGKLENLKPLPPVKWPPVPDATFTTLASYGLRGHEGVMVDVVEWTVDTLRQYGVVIRPKEPKAGDNYPLLLYCHGAAFGLPVEFLDWLAGLAETGYVIAGPAMRGEDLFQRPLMVNGKVLRCEGEIENLEGEVDDCLAMLSAAWKLPYVKPNEFAMVGHSFGAGVGLLVAARSGAKAKAVVSYDAWLVNPQRYCYDRMRRAANNWLSWADFRNQPVANQLNGLKKRSIVQNADLLQCPMLLFMGETYDGSVFHLSHEDLVAELKRLGKPYEYVLIPNGHHNTILYWESEAAQWARRRQDAFLAKHFPPKKKEVGK